MGKHKVTATVYDKQGNVLSVGYNSYIKTHPLQAKLACRCGQPEKVYLHAEIAALVKARGRGYKIKVERFNKSGDPMLAAPCPICTLAIEMAGIEIVEFTTGGCL
jgi:tRNA(Arg) A34 adenosine deaminase TadA